MMEFLRFVTLAECRQKMLDCNNYGHGLDVRRIKKGLKVIEATVERHKNSYDFWLDMFVFKTLRGEGYHWPIRTMSPRWEMEITLDWWNCFFSYSWQGAKQEERRNNYGTNSKG
jgi:hypothetical protein